MTEQQASTVDLDAIIDVRFRAIEAELYVTLDYLRELIDAHQKPWARHGSTIYLWKERDVAKAIEYVMLSQGDELFSLDDD